MLHSCSPSSVSFPLALSLSSHTSTTFSSFLKPPLESPQPTKRRTTSASLRFGPEEIIQVVHNKVLVAATLSTVIGQLSKPFTSAAQGDGFRLERAVGTGGMPSTHSAGVLAAATCLGLERGFSDSIFGVAVVFAAIVMYDAQGVRREVGRHSKILNSLKKIQQPSLLCEEFDPDLKQRILSFPSKSENLASLSPSNGKDFPTPYQKSYSQDSKLASTVSTNSSPMERVDGEIQLECHNKFERLNESAGHTTVEVLVGALLGFLVSLTTEAFF